jgi:hypothetical protein
MTHINVTNYARMASSKLILNEVNSQNYSTTKTQLKTALKNANEKTLFNLIGVLGHAYVASSPDVYMLTYPAIRDYCHLKFAIDLHRASDIEDVDLTGTVCMSHRLHARQQWVDFFAMRSLW